MPQLRRESIPNPFLPGQRYSSSLIHEVADQDHIMSLTTVGVCAHAYLELTSPMFVNPCGFGHKVKLAYYWNQ